MAYAPQPITLDTWIMAANGFVVLSAIIFAILFVAYWAHRLNGHRR